MEIAAVSAALSDKFPRVRLRSHKMRAVDPGRTAANRSAHTAERRELADGVCNTALFPSGRLSDIGRSRSLVSRIQSSTTLRIRFLASVYASLSQTLKTLWGFDAETGWRAVAVLQGKSGRSKRGQSPKGNRSESQALTQI